MATCRANSSPASSLAVTIWRAAISAPGFGGDLKMIFVGNGRGVGPDIDAFAALGDAPPLLAALVGSLNFCGKEDGYEKEEAARGVRRMVWFPPPVHAPGRAP